jgi:ABC-type molybdate transport system substrate-binding protein
MAHEQIAGTSVSADRQESPARDELDEKVHAARQPDFPMQLCLRGHISNEVQAVMPPSPGRRAWLITFGTLLLVTALLLVTGRGDSSTTSTTSGSTAVSGVSFTVTSTSLSTSTSGSPSTSAPTSTSVASSTSSTGSGGDSDTLIVYGAGTLANPFNQMFAAFKQEQPNLTIQPHFAGSAALVKSITELGQPVDVSGTADYSLIPDQMFSVNGKSCASWYVGFVSNEITFA